MCEKVFLFFVVSHSSGNGDLKMSKNKISHKSMDSNHDDDDDD